MRCLVHFVPGSMLGGDDGKDTCTLRSCSASATDSGYRSFAFSFLPCTVMKVKTCTNIVYLCCIGHLRPGGWMSNKERRLAFDFHEYTVSGIPTRPNMTNFHTTPLLDSIHDPASIRNRTEVNQDASVMCLVTDHEPCFQPLVGRR